MKLRYFLLALLIVGCGEARPINSDDANTIYPPGCGSVPNPDSSGCSSFGTSLYTYLTKENAGEDVETGQVNFVSSVTNSTSCLGNTIAGLTMTPSSCIAYNAGIRGTETGSISFPNNSTTWVAMDENTAGSNAGLPNFARVAGTHYLIDSTDATEPAMAPDSQMLMAVVTSGGSITAVTDLRTQEFGSYGSPSCQPITGTNVVLRPAILTSPVKECFTTVLSGNTTWTVFPSTRAPAAGWTAHMIITQPSGGHNYTFTLTNGTGVNVHNTSGCPSLPAVPTATQKSLYIDGIYTPAASTPQLSLLSCPYDL